MYLAVRHFRFFLEGQPFTVFTDHKPLMFCMAKVSQPWSSRHVSHIGYISEYSTHIRHVEGINNLVTDTLSCTLITAVGSSIDYSEMARCQQQDADKTPPYRTAVMGLRWENACLPLPKGVQQ